MKTALVLTGVTKKDTLDALSNKGDHQMIPDFCLANLKMPD